MACSGTGAWPGPSVTSAGAGKELGHQCTISRWRDQLEHQCPLLVLEEGAGASVLCAGA